MARRTLPQLAEAYRAGDVDAQTRLLEEVEPLVLVYVRSSMGERLRTMEESIDISQSLLLGFHLQLASGKVRFENEGALKRYLRTMVKHKLANRADAALAAKRGGGSVPGPLEASLPVASDDPTASTLVRVKETQERVERELSEQERFILEGRLLGRTDREIAQDLGKTPDAVRMIWRRSRGRLVRRGILRDSE